jgi:trans-2,3-dihydro-3-hydroxyanthranilate isomerase
MNHMRRRFYTVDAFTDRAFEGAQIAVLPDARGLTDMQMQQIAREFNLSETVFVSPPMNPGNARRLRIFSPFAEIPFGGHPTIGAAYVLTTIGDITADDSGVEAVDGTLRFTFEQNVGAIHITVAYDDVLRLRFCEFGLAAAYSIDRFTPPDKELAGIFGLTPDELGLQGYSPMVVATDKPFLFVPVSSLASVRRAKFDYRAWGNSSVPSSLTHEALLFSTETEREDAAFHCRLLGPEIGVNEDPPIGSSIPAFAAYLGEVRRPEHHFVAERGAGKFRRSVLHVHSEKRGERSVAVRVGGTAVLTCDGHIHL